MSPTDSLSTFFLQPGIESRICYLLAYFVGGRGQKRVAFVMPEP